MSQLQKGNRRWQSFLTFSYVETIMGRSMEFWPGLGQTLDMPTDSCYYIYLGLSENICNDKKEEGKARVRT